MAKEENFQWLDFERPIGIVALSDIAVNFGTGTLWYVLGEKAVGGRGFTTRAVAEILTLGFGQRRLQAVNAWVVDNNERSRCVLVRNGFRLIGRQRSCHSMEGRVQDRLLFDLLASKHQGISSVSAS